jgi:hypothetical protein
VLGVLELRYTYWMFLISALARRADFFKALAGGEFCDRYGN